MLERAMFRPGDLAAWSDQELVELYEERAAMRVDHGPGMSESDRRQAEHLAAREVIGWIGSSRRAPDKVRLGYLKFKRENPEQRMLF